MKAGARLRAEAAKATDEVVSQGRSLDAVLLATAERIKADDMPLIRMLCYGTIRNHWRLREQLGALLDRPLKRRDSVIESLLAIGLFQLSDTRIPDHASVSMTVEAARLLRRPKYAGLVNAVLRNFVRREVSSQAAATEESRLNHPQWIVDALKRDWPDDWEQISAANDERAPMWLRVNCRNATVEEYMAKHGIAGKTFAAIPGALRLDAPLPVAELPGFADGSVSVQDAGAQIAAPLLLEAGGQRILDACAAPGGKTGHLLERMPADATLTAVDIDEQRLANVRENLNRLKLDATVIAADASKPKEWCETGQFDRILLDAPCSATGVIRRHPDIKLNRRESDIKELAALQGRMLAALWAVLEPAGRLLYATCSVLAEENDAVVRRFLEENSDATENRLLHNYNIRDVMIAKSHGFQVLPGTAGMDGFYYACLDKAPQTG